ncbi:MAG: pyruvate dehydrogenase complex dihydrolipoamide acetyltransferase [Magnetovibrio sp.]|nr:pyruvate dehydrogenase complex dihydrolipoamide acetyltransferase [Magnetovibrio sp.]
MPVEVLMPALSPTMTEGKLANWSIKEGEFVKSGDVLCEIETDKATMEVEAVEEGVLAKIIVAAGTDRVKVNTPIAIILEDGENLVDFASAPKPQPASHTPTQEADVSTRMTAPDSTTNALITSKSRIFASPLAKRIAEEAGISISNVNGSGPNGRIVKRDVDAVIDVGVPVIASGAEMVKTPSVALGSGGYREVPNSTMRQVIASRLLESKQTVPHYYLTIDCHIDTLLSMKETMNTTAVKQNKDYKISVNDFVVRAVAMALRQVPEANVIWTDKAIHFLNDVDVSVAVSTPNGLITPIVRSADKKGLVTISSEIKDLAARARDGKLSPTEYQGGGFTISNLGMFGIKDFVAIINPPQSCILAVGAAEQRAVVKNGELAVATVMSCTLSVDHRSIDGAVGAGFLAAFKRIVEEPLTMIL